MAGSNPNNMTPFEWSMTKVAAKSPMEFVVQLNCVGEVDCKKFTQAILQESKRHPLLQANATIGPTNRLSSWHSASDTDPQVVWIDEEYLPKQGLPDGFQPIDLANEIGIRFYGWRYTADSKPIVVMKFVFHHACCDGKAALDFIEQTLIEYQLILNRKQISSPKPNVEGVGISDRSTVPSQPLKFLDRFYRSFVVRPNRVLGILFQRPCQLHRAESEDIAPVEFYRIPPRQCSVTIDETTTKAIGEFASSLNSTTNLVLARELFHAISEHWIKHGLESREHTQSRPFRIMIPFSLRADRQHSVQVANCVSMIYLEATKRFLSQDSDDNPVLLAELGRQMDYVRRWRLQYSWIESIELYAKYWPLIRFFKRKKTRPPRPIASTVMTNLGRAFNNPRWAGNRGKVKVGLLEVDSFQLALPCNSMLGTNFSVNFYRNRLTLDITYLPSVVKRETAQAMLDCWQERLVRLV